MKKRFTIFLFTILLLSLVSWTTNTFVSKFNINTWRISIGEKTLLSSDKHQMGDVVSLHKKALKPTDFIHAQRYLCGQSADNATTIITVKNSFGKTIKEYKSKSSSIMFEGDIPIKDILDIFIASETIDIYFTIANSPKEINETVLLGRIKLY